MSNRANEADNYQRFSNFMSQEHNLILTNSEMDEIIKEVQKFVKDFKTPGVCDHYYPRGDDMRLNPCEFCGEIKPIAEYEMGE